MRRRGTRLFVLLVVLGATRALAEDAPSGGEPAANAPAAEASAATAPAASSLPYHLTGGLSAGYRLVDVNGSRDKYDEDYNLQPGGRVFLFTLDGEARDPDKPPLPLDRFHLEVDTPGDEPASRFALTPRTGRCGPFGPTSSARRTSTTSRVSSPSRWPVTSA